MAATFVDLCGQTLAADGVAVEPALDGQGGPDFARRAQETLTRLEQEAGSVRCLLVAGPPPYGVDGMGYAEVREAMEAAAVRLSDDLGRLVLVFLNILDRGDTQSPDIVVVDPERGLVGGRLTSDEWGFEFADDVRLDPRGPVDAAVRFGLARLGLADPPVQADYPAPLIARGTISRDWGASAPDRTDMGTAGSVFLLGGLGLAWVIMRRHRARMAEIDASTPGAARAAGARAGGAADLAASRPTRVPQELAARLHTLLGERFALPDPDDARTPEDVDALAELREDVESHRTLIDRVASRLDGAGPWTREEIEDRVPTVEVAALLIGHEALTARAARTGGVRRRSRESRGRSGSAGPVRGARESGGLPRCAFNPFHGRVRKAVRFEIEGTTADVPACPDCRRLTARDERSARGERRDELRVVDARGRVRPYFEVDDAYAHSMLGALSPLFDAVRVPPASQPPAVELRRRSPRPQAGRRPRTLLGRLIVPALIVAGAAVFGAALTMALASFEPETFRAVEDPGPVVAGLAVANWAWGVVNGLIGASLFALGGWMIAGIRWGFPPSASGTDP